jgi:putative spermidine/putrescine transport system permease protein
MTGPLPGTGASSIAAFGPAGAGDAPETTGDLKALLRRTRRVHELKAMALIAPLFLFLLATFVGPILLLLSQSFVDPVVAPILPHVIASLKSWHGPELPPDDAFAAMVADMRAAGAEGTLAQAATRINYDISGLRSLLLRTGGALPQEMTQSPRATLIGIDKRWGELDTWAAIRRASGPVTDLYLLAAVDLRRDAENAITRTPADQRIFITILARTFEIALVTTALCLALGFPLAYLLATLPPGRTNLVLFFVLLPFWTSILVRTLAWFVLLAREGILNDLLRDLGLISDPLHLIFNRTAVYVALVYVFLPYMVLPMFSVMKGIPMLYTRAATSLGATPFAAFRRVYLPQAMPGVSAGCLLVFINALGVYVTPALIGGANDQGISFMIAFYTNKTINWGMGAALSLLLLAATLALYGVYNRLVGSPQLRVG